MMTTHYFVIVAAGSGSRFGSQLPKQFCEMGGRVLLMTTIDSLRRADPQAGIILVLSRDMIEPWKQMCAENQFSLDGIEIVAGGATRTASVAAALAAIPDSAEWISVHDGARPIVPAAMIERLAAARAADIDGIIPAIDVTDSLRELDGSGGGSRAVDRARYRAVQTPQSFPAASLKEAYRRAAGREGFTDDASVMEAAGFTRLVLVEGDHRNIKVTRPGDIEIAELYSRI